MELRDAQGKLIFHIDRFRSRGDYDDYGPYSRSYYRQRPYGTTIPYRQRSSDSYIPYTRPPESPYDPWAQMDQIFSGAGLTRGEHGYDASGLLSTDRYEPFKDSTNIYDASHLLSPSYYPEALFASEPEIMRDLGVRETGDPGIYDAEEISNHGRNVAYDRYQRMLDESNFEEVIQRAHQKNFEGIRRLAGPTDTPSQYEEASRETSETTKEARERNFNALRGLGISQDAGEKNILDTISELRKKNREALEESLNKPIQIVPGRGNEQSTQDTQATQQSETLNNIRLFGLKQNDDGTYSRPGYQGKYYLQADRSFWYEKEQNENIRPHTIHHGQADYDLKDSLPFTKEITLLKNILSRFASSL